jgi:hypothetical protein
MKLSGFAFLFSLLGLGIPGGASAAVATPDGSVKFDAPSLAVGIGDSFTMDLVGRGFTVKLTAGGVNLSYDPAVLRVDSVDIAPVWEFDPRSMIDNASGKIDPISFSSFSNSPTGDFSIATLHFTALAAGTSALRLSLDDIFVFSSDVPFAPPVVPTFIDGLVNVSAVPEPMSVGLLLAGLGLVGARVRLARK